MGYGPAYYRIWSNETLYGSIAHQVSGSRLSVSPRRVVDPDGYGTCSAKYIHA